MATFKPGEPRNAMVEYEASRTMPDTKMPLVITSHTSNPPSHVEHGREYAN